MAYGIIHNNHFYMWHPKKKDGTEMKKTWTQRVWVPWKIGEGDTCVPFKTEEEATAFATETFWKDGSFRIVELDEENRPIITEELEKLGYGGPLPDAE